MRRDYNTIIAITWLSLPQSWTASISGRRKRCAAYNADMCDSLSPPTGLEHNERNLTYLVNNHLPRLTTHGSRIPLMLAALNRDVTNINP